MGKALVCLSGGVDSTAALLECTRLFQRVRAVYVDTSGDGPPLEAEEACRELGLEFTVLRGKECFAGRVKDPSTEMLRRGLTPNPCAMCNASVKLALPFDMLEEGEKLVTGHYASLRNGRLRRGSDRRKDQSYFLSLVPRRILERCFFPLENSFKDSVREMVKASGLPFLQRESQDLCFEPDEQGIPGDIVDTDGVKVGEHKGLHGYTPGQRKGIGAHGEPRFVVRLDHTLNQVVIGGRDSLYSSRCFLDSINWLSPEPVEEFSCGVQIRYRKPEVSALIRPMEDGLSIVFEEPQRAVSPGQTGALYIDDTVLCGGFLSTGRGK